MVVEATSGTSLAGDPLWSDDRVIGPVWSDVLERSIAASPGSAWEIALVSGDPARATTIANGLSPEARDLALLVIPAWGGDASAISALEARALGRSLDIPTITWAARGTARAGDREASLSYRDWASTIDGYAGGSAAEMRLVDRREPGDVIAGSNTGYHGQYVYRRPMPADQLAPGLPRLTYR
jgi:hypothetical protein